MPRRIYLDNAATSWPKPPEVYAAVDHCLRDVGAPAGRSAYAEATEAQQLVAAARRSVAQLLGVDQPWRIVFTFNGTDSLNLAIHGLVRPGDHVVTTAAEHNSVLRPLRHLEETAGVHVTRLDCDAAGRVDPDDVRRALTSSTRLVAITHASNVTGALQPVAEIGQMVRQRDALLLVDAAQTAGHQSIDLGAQQIDLLAAPGHKGLLGPLGTGILYVSARAEPHLQSVRQGGTGTQSEEDRQPPTLPDKFEAGNLNVPGIAGLGAGVDHLKRRGLEVVSLHLAELTHRLADGLRQIGGITVYGPPAHESRAALLSVTFTGYDPQEVAASLDAEYRIQVRSGIHCAPWIHRRLGTLAGGGTVRFSPGPFTTTEDIDAAVEAANALASASTSA